MKVMAVEQVPGIQKGDVYDVVEILDNIIYRIQKEGSDVGWYNSNHFKEGVTDGRNQSQTNEALTKQKTDSSQDESDTSSSDSDLDSDLQMGERLLES